MYWIGLTGGIACGKSSVAQNLRSLGYAVIDADEIARFVVQKNSPGLSAIQNSFGTSILNVDGELDRKKVADIVFKHPDKLIELESILHPLVQEQVLVLKQKLISQKCEMAFYDVPLLFEKKLESQFDAIVVVHCSEQKQLARLQQRSHLSIAEAQLRIQNQLPLIDKIKKAHYTIDNDGQANELQKKVDTFLKQIKNDLKMKSAD